MSLLIVLVYAYTIVSGALLYIFLMGPTEFHKNGLVGKARNFIISLPQTICGGCFKLCCGQRGNEFVKRLENYLCYQKNPVLQLVYLSLMAINIGLFFVFVFPLWPTTYVPAYHKVIAICCVVGTYLSFMRASFSDAGIITKENEARYNESFKNDRLMYFPNRVCSTCGIVKPARSKHCIITNNCIAKFDHFCGWLNNDVGELNYRWFQLFLIMNWISCFYATYIFSRTLWGIIVEQNLLNTVFVTPSGQRINSNLAILLQYMLGHYIVIIAQTFFLFAVGLMIFGFWSYHFFYLTFTNTTTNESFKWKHVEDVYNAVQKYIQKAYYKENDPQALYKYLYGPVQKNKEEQVRKADKGEKEGEDKEAEKKEKIKEWELKQCAELEQKAKKKEKLNYMYNRGIWNNIMEVISPPVLRKGPLPKVTKQKHKDAARFLQ